VKTISTFRLALWSGVLAEIVACGLLLFSSGGYSSFAPGHSHAFSSFISFVFMFHIPGIWLASKFMPTVFFFPFDMVLSGTMSFVIIFWVGISLWRRLHGRNTPA
jgi:hypothetical protein